MTKRFPQVLVGSCVVVGLVLILISLFSSRITWDRETAVAAAQYDGEALIKQLTDLPQTAIEYREIDSGPPAPDLTKVREAWITWNESFSSEVDFAGVIDAYHERLAPLGWTRVVSSEREVASFQNGEWTLNLNLIPHPKPPAATRFLRLIEWRTVVP